MNAPEFEGSLSVRRPNPTLVGLSLVPIAVALLAIASSIAAGTDAFIIAPHLLVFGTIALTTVLRRKPWATTTIEPVRATRDGLRVGDTDVPDAQITRALYVPDGVSDFQLVRVERGRRPAIELVVRDEREARQILVALWRDASQARVSFRAGSPLIASWRFAIVPVMIVAGVLSVMIAGPTNGVGAPVPMLVAFVAVALAFGVPARVEVGADGVLVRWFGTTKFIPAGDIRYTSRFESGFGRNRHVGVKLHLDDDLTYDIVVGSSRWHDDDASALAARVDEVTEAHRRGDAASTVALARAGRPVREWIRALRVIGAGAEVNFRRAEIDREALWRVYESPASTPEERVAAAVALSTQATPETAQRIRVTADTLADPSLREAITTATGSDDEALSVSLRALSAERAREP